MTMKKMDLPSLFPHNHASNILPLSNGDLLCVWFGGSCEGKPDISVQCARFNTVTDQWDVPVVLSGDETRSEQNPILFEREPGEVWLLYTAQIGIHQDTAVVRWRRSYDYGLTWTPIENLFDTKGIFVRNPPVKLTDGRILLPAYYCLKSETGFLGEDYSVMKISDDEGQSWQEVSIDGSEGLVHLSIVKLDNSKIVGFFRDRRAENIYMTQSKDRGQNWSIPVRTELPNNNASIQCTKLIDGRLAMVFNDTDKFKSPPKENKPPWFDQEDLKEVAVKATDKPSAVWGVERSPLLLAVSSDEGVTWTRLATLESKDGISGEPEFSYPSIRQDSNGVLHIAYTYLRKFIRYVRIDNI